MRGWYIRDRDDEKTYICKACGREHDVPYDTCPDCGNFSGKESPSGRNNGIKPKNNL